VREVLAALREKPVVNQVGYMARYSDITQKARELVGEREIGLGAGRFMCRMGDHPWWGKKAVSGGQMLEQSTHAFDWLRLFMGDVQSVQAFGHQGLTNDYTDFEDSTVCNLKFQNGAVATITSTCATNVLESFSTELIGRDFYLKAIMDNELRAIINNEHIEYSGEETGYYRQVEEFLRAVRANDQTLVRSSYEDAGKTLAVTLAANKSLESGRVETVENL
jgi:predicted dehydrogenase